ncbi:hypothetical protein [Pararcticibacter amylolyticus]|uniref:hypothetical protein n=1 Tax=Pararcticibacter amylolyticus TaxID=2173175 RepID=UPI0037429A36
MSSTFNNPLAVVADASGNIYVADAGNKLSPQDRRDPGLHHQSRITVPFIITPIGSVFLTSSNCKPYLNPFCF